MSKWLNKMVIEVEVRKLDGSLIGTTINFPGVVCSYGKDETELRTNIGSAIIETVDLAIENGLGENYVGYTRSFGIKLIHK